MPLDREVGLGPGHIVLDGDPALSSPPSPQKGEALQQTPLFGHMYCGQTAGWIKMPLSREVRLGPGHIVRWGPIAPPPKGTPPIVGPCLLWQQWMDQNGTWQGCLGQGHIVLDGDPATIKGAQPLDPRYRLALPRSP